MVYFLSKAIFDIKIKNTGNVHIKIADLRLASPDAQGLVIEQKGPQSVIFPGEERSFRLKPATGAVQAQATTLQVAISVVAASIWMIKNPKCGLLLPDDLDHEEILKIALPFIKPFVSRAVDWTPLKNWNSSFERYGTPRPADEDVWQFNTFLLRGLA